VHMCSLFHAFILCQLWTVYLENVRPSTSSKVRSWNRNWYRNFSKVGTGTGTGTITFSKVGTGTGTVKNSYGSTTLLSMSISLMPKGSEFASMSFPKKCKN
jgi:hypothetical protein